MDEEVKVTEEVIEEPNKDIHELYAEKKNAFKEKYADVINDLCTKYDKDLGVGLDMLEGIARAKIEGKEPLYVSNVEFDIDGLVEDYVEIQRLSFDIYAGRF